MITFFSCPKAFKGHIDIIQRNAIKSWLRLEPIPEIILIGDDDGVKEMCVEHNLIHIPVVEKNSKGTPLVDSIFNKAKEKASNDILCYINADIILFDDFIPIINDVIKKINTDYLIVGQRTDIDITKPINFNNDWTELIKKELIEKGKLHGPTGKDFFIFRKDFFKNIPPFAIGRGMWDDWFLFYASSQKKYVIDVTKSICVAHQNHDYSHLKTLNKTHFGNNDEWEINVKLSGGITHSYTLADANYEYIDNNLLKKSLYLFFRNIYHNVRPYVFWINQYRKKHKNNKKYKLSFFRGK